MKKWIMLLLVSTLILSLPCVAFAQNCATIQSGTLYSSDGSLITTGYDQWGYNYQAHMFNGGYCDAYRDAAWCQPYADIDLIMKWNDAWLSNKDCDGDKLLDRHFGYPSYIGSGAWLTNHQSGLVEVNGKMKTWTYFCKIVAAPADAVRCGGNWCTPKDEIIGYVIWGDFAVIQEISNDPSLGQHGILYKSAVSPGFGIYGPK